MGNFCTAWPMIRNVGFVLRLTDEDGEIELAAVNEWCDTIYD